MNQDRLNELNQLVTEGIFVAERAVDQNSPKAKEADREVSRLEEEIASLKPASDLEGEIARRGAVRAAMNAGDTRRAIDLAATYIMEDCDKSAAILLVGLIIQGVSLKDRLT